MTIRTALTASLLLSASAVAAPIPGDNRYSDQVRGAWTGKCIGGALGMPLEGWRSAEIRARYPRLDGYVGYFSNAQQGWSDFLSEERIPTDGEWHTMSALLYVPEFDAGSAFAVPIIGRSLERHHDAAAYELRNVRVLRPDNSVPFKATDWQTTSACSWTADGCVRADFTGERSWLKMTSGAARSLHLRPGDPLLIAFEARWLSGDNRIGFALDYLGLAPQAGFGPDDDTSYQIVGLLALEEHGPDISCRAIGDEWVRLLPEIHPSLAEGLALQRMRSGIRPPESGRHPIGEAIGGQMKGEIWGLLCPGRPDLAAEYARRDGLVAHQRNGVYGEQFVAAMMAAAFVERDIPKLIATGLRYIPSDSEYAAVVRGVVSAHATGRPWPEVLAETTAKYPGVCDPVYAEAGIVTLALLYGGGDFDRTITLAAQCGNDTDCNTATVGALLGCIQGYNRIPRKWRDPIGNDFRCFVKGCEAWKITDLTKRIAAARKKVEAFHGEGTRFTTPE